MYLPQSTSEISFKHIIANINTQFICKNINYSDNLESILEEKSYIYFGKNRNNFACFKFF